MAKLSQTWERRDRYVLRLEAGMSMKGLRLMLESVPDSAEVSSITNGLTHDDEIDESTALISFVNVTHGGDIPRLLIHEREQSDGRQYQSPELAVESSGENRGLSGATTQGEVHSRVDEV
jgi:hypothetical protein